MEIEQRSNEEWRAPWGDGGVSIQDEIDSILQKKNRSGLGGVVIHIDYVNSRGAVFTTHSYRVKPEPQLVAERYETVKIYDDGTEERIVTDKVVL